MTTQTDKNPTYIVFKNNLIRPHSQALVAAESHSRCKTDENLTNWKSLFLQPDFVSKLSLDVLNWHLCSLQYKSAVSMPIDSS